MSEWFYINQWRMNESKVWFLYDKSTHRFLLENATKREVMIKQASLESKDCLLIVNKFETVYNDIINKGDAYDSDEYKRRV